MKRERKKKKREGDEERGKKSVSHVVPEGRQFNESLWTYVHTSLNSPVNKYIVCMKLLAGLKA